MRIERSFLPGEVELANTSSIKQQMLSGLQASKEYRHAFVDEAIRTRITAQIKALRDERGLDYKEFAEQIDKKPSWVYRLEDPNVAPPTIPTLLQIAEAFDIGLDVRFRSFSELLEDIATLKPTSFEVPSFDAELKSGAFWRSLRTRKILRYKRKSRHRSTHGAKHSLRKRGHEANRRIEVIVPASAVTAVGAVSSPGSFQLAS
jgi:transcriptional regulator with XRE-family HTH domain